MASLERSLNRAVLGVLAVTLLLGSLVSYLGARGALYGHLDRLLRERAEALAALVEVERTPLSPDRGGWVELDLERDKLEALLARDDGEQVIVRTLEGVEILKVGAPLDRGGQRSVRVEVRPPVELEPDLVGVSNEVAAAAGMVALPEHEADPVIVVEVVRSSRGVSQALRLFVAGIALFTALLLGAGALAASFAVRQRLRPVQALSLAADEVDVSSLHVRLPEERAPDELRPLIARFNQVLGRVEEGFARERSFTSAAAHELRNPVSELRTACEVGLRVEDEDGLRQAAQQSLEVAVRMERIVTTLLSLAREENGGTLDLQPDEMAVAEVLEDALAPLLAIVEERELVLDVEVPTQAALVTDPTLLRLILQNLLTNAVEHSPVGSTVVVRVHQSGEGTTWTVTNPAPALEPDDVERMFQPFWRAAPSEGGDRHTGLGLTLARRLAERLGGDLQASLAPSSQLSLALRV